jgi:hypothetical protein
MVLRYLHIDLQARNQICYYLSLVHESLKRFDLDFWRFGTLLRHLTAYQIIRLRWGASQVPLSARNMSPPYPIWGLKSLIGPFQPPQIFLLLSILHPSWVDTWGGGQIGSSPLLFLPKLHCQPNLGYPFSLPPFYSFWVAPNDLSTPYDLLPWSREMPQLAVVNKTLMT